MLSNYFTFRHIAQELNGRYANAVIAEAYSQEKNTLSIVVYMPEPHTIVISCAARQNFISVRTGNPRSKNNSVDLFPSLINDHIRSVVMDSSDRILYFHLLSGSVLCAEMFGGKANVAMCSSDGIITDAFLNKKELLGLSRTIQLESQSVAVGNFLPEKDSFLNAFAASGRSPYQILKMSVPKLGSTLSKEVIHRAGVPENAAVLSDEQKERIYEETSSILRSLITPAGTLESIVYFEESFPVVITLLPLRYYESLRKESYPDIFTAIQKFLSYGRSEHSYTDKKKTILHWLNNESARMLRTIAAVEKELAESSRAEQYERYGKLLMSNLHVVAKGLKTVEIGDHFSGGENVTIPLDAALSPVHNAERYFEKSKRAKSARDESADRLISLRERYKALETLQRAMENVSDSISLKNFIHSQDAQLKKLGYMTEKEQEDLPPFKTFTVDGGFTVYAGKSSDNNDLLTVKWAKPNDLWFHARGSSGSHVVLKVGSGNGTPSKKAIEQSAAIAAYYSKMKNARNVPVAMTEKKYVRKPKGVPAGTVVIEREKVIFVTPGLPHTEE